MARKFRRFAGWTTFELTLGLLFIILSTAHHSDASTTSSRHLTACQRAILRSGTSFIVAKLTALQTCTAGILDCIETKYSDPTCLARAAQGCNSLLTTILTSENTFAKSIDTACHGSTPDELSSASGLGYGVNTSHCADEYGADITTFEGFITCVVRDHARIAELILNVEQPRTVKLLECAGVSRVTLCDIAPNDRTCLGGVNAELICTVDSDCPDSVCKPVVHRCTAGPQQGKLCTKDSDCSPGLCASDCRGVDEDGHGHTPDSINLCATAISKAAATFVKDVLGAIAKCDKAALACAFDTPPSSSCITKANGICGKLSGAMEAARESLTMNIADNADCTAVPFSELKGMTGLGLVAATSGCDSVGTSLTDLTSYATCLRNHGECRIDGTQDALIPFVAPRFAEILNMVGVPDPFCSPSEGNAIGRAPRLAPLIAALSTADTVDATAIVQAVRTVGTPGQPPVNGVPTAGGFRLPSDSSRSTTASGNIVGGFTGNARPVKIAFSPCGQGVAPHVIVSAKDAAGAMLPGFFDVELKPTPGQNSAEIEIDLQPSVRSCVRLAFATSCGTGQVSPYIQFRQVPPEAPPVLSIQVLRNSEGAPGIAGARSVAVSNDGANVYTASELNNAVVVFARDKTTGELTFDGRLCQPAPGFPGFEDCGKDAEGNTIDGLDTAKWVTVSPDNKNVYAAGQDSHAIVAFRRDPQTGALTFLEAQKNGTNDITGLGKPRMVVVSPTVSSDDDGADVYAVAREDNSVVAFRRDRTSGTLMHNQTLTNGVDGVTGLGGPMALVVTPDGLNVYVAARDGNALVMFQRAPGTGTGKGKLAFKGSLHSMTDTNGIDALNGPDGIAVSPDGESVYVASISSPDNDAQHLGGALAVFHRDSQIGSPTFGLLTFVDAKLDGQNGVDGVRGARAVTVSPDGSRVYVASAFDNALAVFDRVSTDGETSPRGAVTFRQSFFDGVAGIPLDSLQNPSAVAVSVDNQNVYVAAETGGTVAVFTTR